VLINPFCKLLRQPDVFTNPGGTGGGDAFLFAVLTATFEAAPTPP